MSRNPSMVTLCRFGDEHGFGHVTRSAALNHYARTLGWETELCTSSDPSNLTNELFRSFSKITQYDELELEAMLSSRSELDIVLIDEMYESDSFYQRARSIVDLYSGAKLIAMDDMKVRSMQAVHWVINTELGLIDADYKSEKCLLGEKYALLRSGFSNARLEKRKIASDLLKVLIMIGGTDPGGWTERALDSLYRFKGSKFAPTVVSGDGKNRARVVESLSRFSSFEYKCGLNSHELADCISDCQFGIIGCGSSVYELASMKCRFIGICVADNQENMAKRVQSKWNLPVVFGDSVGDFPADLDTALNQLIKELENENEAMSWGIDCLGPRRVMEEIGRL